MTDKSNRRPDRVAQAGLGYAPVRPRVGMADFLVQFWRSKWLILAGVTPILAMGVLFASNAPTTFESRAVLYVSSEMPGTGNTSLAQSEREILKTRLVAERTLSRFPLTRIYPGLVAAQDRALSRTPEQTGLIRDAFFQRGVDAFEKAIHATAVSNSDILNVRVAHEDPQIAAELLNAVIAVYLQRRRELFAGAPISEDAEKQQSAQADLLKAEDAIRVFLSENAIRDFNSERATAQALHAVVSGELLAVEAQQKAIRAQLQRVRAQLANTPSEQDLFVEDSTADRLFDLEIERNQALVTYLPDSQRVQALEAQIADLRTRMESPQTLQGTVRRGPNPTYQALEISQNSFEAEAESLAQKRAELERQLAAVEEKLERFTALESEWKRLQRTRDALEVSVFGALEQDPTLAGSAMTQPPGGVKIAEPATVPRTGRSAALSIYVLSGLAALFIAAVIALLRSRSMQSFATPGAFTRTTGLPLLAAIGRG